MKTILLILFFLSVKCYSCPIPTTFTVTTFADSAQIAWNDCYSSFYSIRYKKVGETNWSYPQDILTTRDNPSNGNELIYITTEPRYTLTGLQPQTGYYYEVISSCWDNSKRPYSSPQRFRTK